MLLEVAASKAYATHQAFVTKIYDGNLWLEKWPTVSADERKTWKAVAIAVVAEFSPGVATAVLEEA